MRNCASAPRSVPVARLAQLEDGGQFRLLAYLTDVRGWLDDCVESCQAEKVRWSLRHNEDGWQLLLPSDRIYVSQAAAISKLAP